MSLCCRARSYDGFAAFNIGSNTGWHNPAGVEDLTRAGPHVAWRHRIRVIQVNGG